MSIGRDELAARFGVAVMGRGANMTNEQLAGAAFDLADAFVAEAAKRAKAEEEPSQADLRMQEVLALTGTLVCDVRDLTARLATIERETIERCALTLDHGDLYGAAEIIRALPLTVKP